MTHETVPSEITAPKGKAKAVVFSLLTLLSGIVIGSGLTLMIKGPDKTETPPALPEEFSRRMVEHLTRELNLTPEQGEKIQPVVESHMKVIDAYREEARPKIRTELDTMNEEILSILDDQQQQIWKDKIERMKKRFQEMRQRRGDGDRRGDGPPRGDRDRDDWRRRRRGGDPNAPQFPPPPMPPDGRFGPGPGPKNQPPQAEIDDPLQPL